MQFFLWAMIALLVAVVAYRIGRFIIWHKKQKVIIPPPNSGLD